jgi:hypothetical protein
MEVFTAEQRTQLVPQPVVAPKQIVKAWFSAALLLIGNVPFDSVM